MHIFDCNSAILMYNKDNKSGAIDLLITNWEKDHPDLDKSAVLILDLLISIGKAVENAKISVINSITLYAADIDILLYLRASGTPYQLAPTRLMSSVNITSGAMTAALNRLEKKKLINRVADPKDGRGSLAELSKEGIRHLNSVISARIEYAQLQLETFDELEKRQFVRLLQKMKLKTHG